MSQLVLSQKEVARLQAREHELEARSQAAEAAVADLSAQLTARVADAVQLTALLEDMTAASHAQARALGERQAAAEEEAARTDRALNDLHRHEKRAGSAWNRAAAARANEAAARGAVASAHATAAGLADDLTAAREALLASDRRAARIASIAYRGGHGLVSEEVVALLGEVAALRGEVEALRGGGGSGGEAADAGSAFGAPTSPSVGGGGTGSPSTLQLTTRSRSAARYKPHHWEQSLRSAGGARAVLLAGDGGGGGSGGGSGSPASPLRARRDSPS